MRRHNHQDIYGLCDSPTLRLGDPDGLTMKPTIFNEKVAKALRHWHYTAKKHIKQSHHSGSMTPLPSRPRTPLHGMSPVHLLRHYCNIKIESAHMSPRASNYNNEFHEAAGSTLPSHRHTNVSWSHHIRNHDPEAQQQMEGDEELNSMHSTPRDL